MGWKGSCEEETADKCLMLCLIVLPCCCTGIATALQLHQVGAAIIKAAELSVASVTCPAAMPSWVQAAAVSVPGVTTVWMQRMRPALTVVLFVCQQLRGKTFGEVLYEAVVELKELWQAASKLGAGKKWVGKVDCIHLGLIIRTVRF